MRCWQREMNLDMKIMIINDNGRSLKLIDEELPTDL
jgi:hypothetical protein